MTFALSSGRCSDHQLEACAELSENEDILSTAASSDDEEDSSSGDSSSGSWDSEYEDLETELADRRKVNHSYLEKKRSNLAEFIMEEQRELIRHKLREARRSLTHANIPKEAEEIALVAHSHSWSDEESDDDDDFCGHDDCTVKIGHTNTATTSKGKQKKKPYVYTASRLDRISPVPEIINTKPYNTKPDKNNLMAPTMSLLYNPLGQAGAKPPTKSASCVEIQSAAATPLIRTRTIDLSTSEETTNNANFQPSNQSAKVPPVTNQAASEQEDSTEAAAATQILAPAIANLVKNPKSGTLSARIPKRSSTGNLVRRVRSWGSGMPGMKNGSKAPALTDFFPAEDFQSSNPTSPAPAKTAVTTNAETPEQERKKKLLQRLDKILEPVSSGNSTVTKPNPDLSKIDSPEATFTSKEKPSIQTSMGDLFPGTKTATKPSSIGPANKGSTGSMGNLVRKLKSSKAKPVKIPVLTDFFPSAHFRSPPSSPPISPFTSNVETTKPSTPQERQKKKELLQSKWNQMTLVAGLSPTSPTQTASPTMDLSEREQRKKALQNKWKNLTLENSLVASPPTSPGTSSTELQKQPSKPQQPKGSRFAPPLALSSSPETQMSSLSNEERLRKAMSLIQQNNLKNDKEIFLPATHKMQKQLPKQQDVSPNQASFTSSITASSNTIASNNDTNGEHQLKTSKSFLLRNINKWRKASKTTRDAAAQPLDAATFLQESTEEETVKTCKSSLRLRNQRKKSWKKISSSSSMAKIFGSAFSRTKLASEMDRSATARFNDSWTADGSRQDRNEASFRVLHG